MFLHPIVIHFPIALLTVYSILEIIRFKNDDTKRVLVILGTLGAYVAALTGPGGEGVRILDMHELFAKLTIIIYSLIAISYIDREFIKKTSILIILALLGLASITITGGLGGAMVYGTSFDPFMAPVFKLLNVY